jgi:hypothetical protein
VSDKDDTIPSRTWAQAMTAHRFRDSVATSIANEDPTKVRYAAQMLGHKRTTTTERHYIARDNATALVAHHDRIKSIRKRTTSDPKRQPRRDREESFVIAPGRGLPHWHRQLVPV